MRRSQRSEPLFLADGELVIDNFAGGGGATAGIAQALGRVDVAINHDAEAVAMHAINHPETRHYCESVWKVDPVEITSGKPVALAWFSPDCKHFSKAKGGKPVEKKIRGLAWVVIRWARRVKPRVIMLENVEEFQDWGPLTDDGMPCPRGRGKTFTLWINQLRRFGYAVEWRELRACDYGAPTIRKRLFVIARCDGLPIVWPKPTHGPGRLPYRTAADCIDWSLPCRSIFERERPLAENTMRRIARGVMKYVIDAAEPFVVPMQHSNRPTGVDEPVQTITTQGNKFNLVVPYLVPRYGERDGQDPRSRSVQEPMPTIVPTENHGHLVAAFLAKHNGIGAKQVVGQPLTESLHTITSTDQKALVASSLVKLRGTSSAQGVDEPLHTISAQGTHFGEVRAFLLKYYGNERDGVSLTDPMHTVTATERFGLVTVHGEDYAIVDIGMRMLSPRELYRAQGFPDHYIIEFEHAGRPLPKSSQVRMCGNSVCPPLAEALVRANCIVQREAEAA